MDSAGEVAFVALGSNLGDRGSIFSTTIRALEADASLDLIAASPVFETDPVGPGEQGAYFNAVVCLRTGLAPPTLLRLLQDIEVSLGRDRSEAAVRWGPRTIDLDILFYGERRIETPDLVIPHPRAHERAFVLVPMAALAPDFVHPVLGSSMQTLVSMQLEDESMRRMPDPEGWPRSDSNAGSSDRESRGL